MDHSKQHIISIATGIQGLERGLEQAGVRFRVAAFVEIEAFIIANLASQMEKGKLAPAPIWADVKTFPGEKFHGKIHGITAGYPCQPFSIAGKRQGEDDPRHIFPHILRIVESVNPIWVFLENVEGHISMGYGEVYRSLHDLGYKIEAGIFSAEEVGAPHQRRRLFILGIKMEYSNASKIKRIFFGSEKKFSDIRSSGEVANTNYDDSRGRFSHLSDKSCEIEIASQRKNGKWVWDESCNGLPIPNTDCQRDTKSILRAKTKQFVQNGNQWPAFRNKQQHKWEAPRTIPKRIRRKGKSTIKPGMGGSTDGYNFRVDLLRSLGNGVVSQTASKAFQYLLSDFF